MRSLSRCAFVLVAAATMGCGGLSVGSRILVRNLDALGRTLPEIPSRIERIERSDVRLAVLWVGHATTVVQLDDTFIVTDPVFTETVGQFSRRLVRPGVEASALPPLDVAVVSHAHFDHLSYGTLDLLAPKLGTLLVPSGALPYVPEVPFQVDALGPFETARIGELRVTAVPVDHIGGRYGIDAGWTTEAFTGWVFEHRGLVVYFGGDTAYDQHLFRRTAERFPRIDVAILPIAPVEPPEFARPTHMDGREAIRAFQDLGADHLVPIHFDTFAHGVDEPGVATRLLRRAMAEAGLTEERVHVLPIGGQLGLFPVAESDLRRASDGGMMEIIP